MNTAMRSIGKLAVGVVLVAAWASVSSASGGCISVDVAAPIMLPSGSVEPPGTLTLCPERSLSPATSMHKILVGRIPLEFAQGQSARSESSELDAPIVLFLRRADGTLRLAGFASSEGRVVRTHLLRGVPGRFQAALATGHAGEQRDEWVLMAARTR